MFFQDYQEWIVINNPDLPIKLTNIYKFSKHLTNPPTASLKRRNTQIIKNTSIYFLNQLILFCFFFFISFNLFFTIKILINFFLIFLYKSCDFTFFFVTSFLSIKLIAFVNKNFNRNNFLSGFYVIQSFYCTFNAHFAAIY